MQHSAVTQRRSDAAVGETKRSAPVPPAIVRHCPPLRERAPVAHGLSEEVAGRGAFQWPQRHLIIPVTNETHHELHLLAGPALAGSGRQTDQHCSWDSADERGRVGGYARVDLAVKNGEGSHSDRCDAAAIIASARALPVSWFSATEEGGPIIDEIMALNSPISCAISGATVSMAALGAAQYGLYAIHGSPEEKHSRR